MDPPDAPANTLSPQEQRDGWRLLFDGHSLDGWHAYQHRDSLPLGWVVNMGALCNVNPSGDLVTGDTYGDFELMFEWKVGPAGEGGVFFRVDESRPRPWQSGHEMQILDNEFSAKRGNPKTRAGACYGLFATSKKPARPVGEWNEAKIVARGPSIEFWLNGEQTVAFAIGEESWRKRVSRSRSGRFAGFGETMVGKIVLQDLGGPVWFRNMKIRELR